MLGSETTFEIALVHYEAKVAKIGIADSVT